MPRKRVFKTREAAVEAMSKIVGREVKHYLTDWTDYDQPSILDSEKVKEGKSYIWITRECGTYLFQSDFYDSLRAVIECWGPDNVHTRQLTVFPDKIELIVVDPEDVLETSIQEIKKQTATP